MNHIYNRNKISFLYKINWCTGSYIKQNIINDQYTMNSIFILLNSTIIVLWIILLVLFILILYSYYTKRKDRICSSEEVFISGSLSLHPCKKVVPVFVRGSLKLSEWNFDSL